MEQMNPRPALQSGDRSDDAREYLASLRGLSSELQRAMEAIVSGELPSLQDSLHLQRSRCARLSDLRHSPQVRQLLEPATDATDCDLCLEIAAATESLLALNLQYSGLIKHSGETLRLLAGMYQGYEHQGYLHQEHQALSRTAFSGQTGRQSWHCEI